MSPWTLIEVAIEPKSASDADLLYAALSRLVDETQISFTRDQESGGFLLGGMSEDHLQIAIDRLRNVGNPQFNVGALQIAYRELLSRPVRIDYVHKRIIGLKGEFARVLIDFAPTQAGVGFKFENKASAAIPSEYVPSVEKGLHIASQNGVRAGFPLINFAATLVGGAYHDIDSSPLAFQIAAQSAVRELKEKGDVQIAEPVMIVELSAPEEFMNAIISDLNARRGEIQNRRANGNIVTIDAAVPLANMFGYAGNLSRISQRRASFTMQFGEYRVIPLHDDDPTFPPAVGMRA